MLVLRRLTVIAILISLFGAAAGDVGSIVVLSAAGIALLIIDVLIFHGGY